MREDEDEGEDDNEDGDEDEGEGEDQGKVGMKMRGPEGDNHVMICGIISIGAVTSPSVKCSSHFSTYLTS